MTREERINSSAHEYCSTIDIDYGDWHGFDYEDIEYAFVEGATWADSNICLSSIWNDINIVSSDNKGIIYLTKKGKIGVIKAINSNKWDWYVADKYSIIKWAYVDDLLPK